MIRNALHKIRLMLAGVLIAVSVAGVAQISGNSGISGPPPRDASLLQTGTLDDARLSSNVALYDASVSGFTTGTLSDARLSANVPLASAANIFTAIPQSIAVGGSPRLVLDDTNAASNERIVSLINVDGVFRIDLPADGASAGNPFMSVQRSGTTASSIDFTGDTLTVNNDEVATQESGSFTLQESTGCATSPSGTAFYSRNGNSVTVDIPTVTCTTNTTSFTFGTGFPAAIRPAADQATVCKILNDGTDEVGICAVKTNGSMEIFRFDFSLFVNGGFAGTGSSNITYLLTQ